MSESYSINEWCAKHKVSPACYYVLKTRGDSMNAIYA
jgi:hypothetical protein